MKIDERYESMRQHIANAYDSAAKKEAVLPENKNLQSLASTIDSIQKGQAGNDYAENLAYVEQQDFINDITGTRKYVKYTQEEINHIGKLLTNMTEGE